MTDHVETVEHLVRVQLAKALGGRRGVLESAVPTIAFTIAWIIGHELKPALIISIGAAVTLLIVRLLQRSNPQFVVNALVGIAIAAVFATGDFLRNFVRRWLRRGFLDALP